MDDIEAELSMATINLKIVAVTVYDRASGKVRGCDPALSTKNRTISHYSLFPALCRTFRVYLLKKPISYKISFENRNKCDELCVYKMI